MSEKKFEDELFGDLDLGPQADQPPPAPAALTQVPGFETLSVSNLEALEERQKMKNTSSSIKSALKEPPPKGPSQKMIVLVALAVLVFVGGGVGVMYSMGIGFFAETKLPPIAQPNPGGRDRVKKKRQLLFLGTKPKGAEVWINGVKYKSKTPVNLVLLPNRKYKFVLKFEGYLPLQKNLDVKAPQTPISWKLELKSDPKKIVKRPTRDKNGEGYVKVTCDPMGALIKLGKSPEVKCPATIQIEGGTHPIKVEKEGYGTYSAGVTVYPAQVITLPVKLRKLTKREMKKLAQMKAKEAKDDDDDDDDDDDKPKPRRRYRPRGKGTVIIACSEKATVKWKVGGRWKRLGRTPLTVKLPSGNQSIRLYGPRGALREEKIRVRYKKTVSRNLSFRKGKIRFQVKPWADVWINGQKIGQTPMPPYTVREGYYKVTLTNGKNKETKRVRVKGNQTAYVFHYFSG